MKGERKSLNPSGICKYAVCYCHSNEKIAAKKSQFFTDDVTMLILTHLSPNRDRKNESFNHCKCSAAFGSDKCKIWPLLNLFIEGSIYYLLYAYLEVTVQICGKFITDYFKVPHRYKLQGLHLCAMRISPIAQDFTMGYIQ